MRTHDHEKADSVSRLAFVVGGSEGTPVELKYAGI